MNILQKQLDDFVLNWEPGMTSEFVKGIDPDTTIRELNEIKSDYISYIDREKLEDYIIHVVLNETMLDDHFFRRQSIWTREKEMHDEFFGRRSEL